MLQCHKLLAPVIATAVAMATLKACAVMLEGVTPSHTAA